jgi:signal transduction histidine kinase
MVATGQRDADLLELASAALEHLNQPAPSLDLVRSLLHLIREQTGLSHVSIRLRQGDAFPLYVAERESLRLVPEAEHPCLVAARVRAPLPTCLCGQLLLGEPPAGLRACGGSLCLEVSAAERWRPTRDHLPAALAWIPVRSGGELLGLLHLGGTAVALHPERVAHLDRLAACLGIALGRRRGEALSEQHTAELTFLAETGLRLLELAPGEDIYQVIGERLREIVGDAMVAVCHYDEEAERIHVRSLLGLGSLSDALVAALGRTIDNFAVTLTPEIASDLRQGRLVTLGGSLHELVNRALPELACRGIERLLRVDSVHAIGFVRRGRLLGSMALVTRQGGRPVNLPLIEAFTTQAAVALERHLAEQERHQIEEQLRHSQRLEAIGTLAGAVAHDFNNMLTVILSLSAMAAQELPEGMPQREDLEEIQRAAQRAERLTRQLLTFARRQVMRIETVDLCEVVRSIRGMLGRLLGEDIEVRIELEESPARVRVDVGQIEQVIVNLATNARDAMPRGGLLRIRVEAQRDANQVLLTVSDTGRGMDAETRRRALEPFFTTKEAGRGTGLGLSTTYAIVEQFGGRLALESAPGAGTTVSIYLPVASDEATRTELRVAATAPDGGNETVLVVEDEEVVRRLAIRVLGQRGYTTLVARDGLEAQRIASDHAGPIHLLLSDVVMPGMSGGETARLLRAARPELKVLFMSGYVDRSRDLLEPAAEILEKPFTGALLAAAVRRALDHT